MVIVERTETNTADIPDIDNPDDVDYGDEEDDGDDGDDLDNPDNTDDGPNEIQMRKATLDKGRSNNHFCFLPHTKGFECKARLIRYHYSYMKQKCERIIYGGCNATPNNFKTMEDCLSKCVGPSKYRKTG